MAKAVCHVRRSSAMLRRFQMMLGKAVTPSSMLLCLLLVTFLHVWNNYRQILGDKCSSTRGRSEDANHFEVGPVKPSEPSTVRSDSSLKYYSAIDTCIHSFRENIPLTDDRRIRSSTYFKLRSAIVNPLMTNYMIEPPKGCGVDSPYLLAMIPSLTEHAAMRTTIRATWGSVVKLPWPGTSHDLPVKIVFVFGRSNASDELSILEAENRAHGDILYVDFVDSYRNLTYKSLTSLYWASSRCPGAKFFMKVDEDTFVNVPYLLDYLRYHERDLRRCVVGYTNKNPVTVRHGKWKVNYDAYNLSKYPSYLYGHSYVITSDVIADIVHASQHMPYIPVEDASVTGVLAYTLNVSRLHNSMFAREGNVYSCTILRNTKISITPISDGDHIGIWRDVQKGICSYKIIHRLRN